jgi:hypothetical protein
MTHHYKDPGTQARLSEFERQNSLAKKETGTAAKSKRSSAKNKTITATFWLLISVIPKSS